MDSSLWPWPQSSSFLYLLPLFMFTQLSCFQRLSGTNTLDFIFHFNRKVKKNADMSGRMPNGWSRMKRKGVQWQHLKYHDFNGLFTSFLNQFPALLIDLLPPFHRSTHLWILTKYLISEGIISLTFKWFLLSGMLVWVLRQQQAE